MTYQGKLYWRANGNLVQSYDTTTETLTGFTNGDPSLPNRNRFGTLLRFGAAAGSDIAIFNRGNNEDAFIVNAAFVYQNYLSLPFYSGGYTQYELGDSAWDGSKMWTNFSDDAAPSAFTARSQDGTLLATAGDSDTVPSAGDSFIGQGPGIMAGMSVVGDTLYRATRYSDGIMRYNLTTNAWEMIASEAASVSGDGAPSMYVGTDPVTGLIVVVDTASTSSADYKNQTGWVSTFSIDAQPWAPVINYGAHLNGRVNTWNPSPTGDAATTIFPSGTARSLLVRNGKLYYYVKSAPTDFGTRADGFTPWGTVMAVYEMDLLTGAVGVVAEIPYALYNADGSVAVDGNYWADNDPYGFSGLILDEFAAAPPTTLTAEFTFASDETGRSVTFDASLSRGDTITSYAWDFGENYTVLPPAQPADGQIVEHMFYSFGPFQVTLTVTDSNGVTASVTHEVDMAGLAINGDYDNDRCAFSGAG